VEILLDKMHAYESKVETKWLTNKEQT